MMLRSLTAVAALSACNAVRTSNLRVAVYIGSGATNASYGGYTTAMSDFVQNGIIGSTVNYTATDVESLQPGDVDVIIFPGGYSPTEGTAITQVGINAVRTYVMQGGGYIGTCAGAYLAGTAQCCHTPDVYDYCSNPGFPNVTKPGCYSTPWSIGLIDMGTANPWDRGHGPVNISFSTEGAAMLGLDPTKYGPGINTTITYWQGPIQDKSYPWTGFTSLATYESEINYINHNETAGVMVGTPAIITTEYGLGRVLASSPHPEETEPMILDLIAGYVLWAGKAI